MQETIKLIGLDRSVDEIEAAIVNTQVAANISVKRSEKNEESSLSDSLSTTFRGCSNITVNHLTINHHYHA